MSVKRRGMLWVIAALCISMFPQLINMPIHLVSITLLPIVWRLLAELRNWKPIPLVLRVFATVVAVAALVMTYGGLVGRRAAVSLLVLMLSLKLLETFRTRDARIVASLSLFLCSTQFLFSQGVPMIFYIVACLLSSLTALMYLQRREAYEDLGRTSETGQNLFTELGFGIRLLVLAFPIGLALFLLFPRWSNPMWGVPENALDARSGLSNSMSPGSIQSLFMDDSPAFRVKFNSALPNHSELYWRGPVFWDFDGSTWKTNYLSRNLLATEKPEPANAILRYEVQMEPTEQHSVFALDYPAIIPRGVNLTMDYQLLSRRPITNLRDYDMASDPRFVDSRELKITLRRAALELPDGFNPRTAELIAQWRQEASSDSEMVRRALSYFNQQQFHYTLNPALLSQHTVDEFLFDTKEGFCEHYASAFTVMMRMAGIPSRVVTGYMGGWFNDIGSYLLVRQSDAHAWSEVWIKGSGWFRIDPTAVVAPSRVEQGAVESLAQRRHALDFEWLREVRNSFDALQRGWNNWVVAFNSDRQSRLFSNFGWDIVDTAKLFITLIAVILIISAVIFLLTPFIMRFRSSQQKDPFLQSWQKFVGKLTKLGFVAHPSMGPVELAASANCQLDYRGESINYITDLYILCRYSKQSNQKQEFMELVKNFELRPVS